MVDRDCNEIRESIQICGTARDEAEARIVQLEIQGLI